ncbi:MAG: V4R domain-containing protein [Candidatus Micrarchaeia archaeon]
MRGRIAKAGADKARRRKVKHIKAKARKAAPRRREIAVEPLGLGAIPRSYEETLLEDITRGSTAGVSKQVFTLTGALASLTPKLREVYFSHGFRVGEILYKLARHTAGSSATTVIPMLVEFLSKAGYSSISYMPKSGSYEFKIADAPLMKLGVNIHSFEAGIISGFMSEEYRRIVRFTESECRSNGGDSCIFVESDNSEMDDKRLDSDRWISEFSNYIINSAQREKSKLMNYNYYCLASDSLLHGEYASGLGDIAYVAGSGLGRRLGEEHEGIGDEARMRRLRELIALLNFGNITIKRSAPISLHMEFDRLMAKKDMIALASNFMNGMLNAYLGSRLVETQRSSFGKYTIDIREAAQGARNKIRTHRK